MCSKDAPEYQLVAWFDSRILHKNQKKIQLFDHGKKEIHV